MDNYSLSSESARILHDVLLADPKLALPASFREAAKLIHSTGKDDKPYILTPLKITESSASLHALVATAASVAVDDRYKVGYQSAEVNLDLATLFLESVLLVKVGDRPFLENDDMKKELRKMDLHAMSKPIRRYATTVYQTKDGRWYHLHGSMNAEPTMEMMGVEDSNVTREEAINIYTKKVAEWDSKEIEVTANEKFRQAGVLCYTADEFFASEQGKIMGAEPLWNKTKVPAPRKPWPTTQPTDGLKPLAGIKVLDFSRVIAAPAVTKILALLGADVLRISNENLPEYAATMPDLQTGKRDANLDLKSEEGKEKFAELIKGADILLDGYRPGALKKLGFDSKSLRSLNPSLIYVRECCYGFKGPLAYRSGWQQISDCLVGLSHAQGQFLGLNEAIVPLLPNSDYQTGLIGAAAVLEALVARAKEDVTFDIDISLTQYNIWFYRLGLYNALQQKDLRARDPDFLPRHSDDMPELVGKTHQSLLKIRPDILVDPSFYWEMSGAEYGLSENLSVIAPAISFEKTKLEYIVPTGRRGRSQPIWLS